MNGSPDRHRRILPRRILVLCLSGIGDAARFLPALALLRRSFPEARITVVTMFRGAFELLEYNSHLDDLRCIDFFNSSPAKRIFEALRLRCERFDLSILSFPSNRLEYNIAQWIVGCRWRAAHRYMRQSIQNLWFLNNIVLPEEPHLHNVEENLRLVQEIARRFGVRLEDSASACGPALSSLPGGDGCRPTASQPPAVPGTGRLKIAIHPYSSTFKNMHRKCWPAVKFAELVNVLADQYPGARFLLLSGPDDQEVSRRILALVHSPVLLVEDSLHGVIALLRECDLFIGNDAGITHVAAAAGIPVIAVFGPTDWNKLHPWCEHHIVVKRDLWCMPCFYYSSRPLRCGARMDYACVRELPVADIARAVSAMLARLKRPPRLS